MIEATSQVQRNPRAVFRELADDSGVILHLDTSSYHGVNATGALLWELTEDSPSYAQLVESARARFKDAPPEFDEDVEEFVLALVERDLLTLVPASEE